jgi:hypothetical protein
VDILAGLSITGPTTNASVSCFGLASNTVYVARIELQDALGRKTTNIFTFDTFTDAYLASAAARNIECEEYDFDGGQYFDNPTISGYTTNGVTVNVGSPNTYADQTGTRGVDFFDYDGGVHALENEFRSYDPVGTQNGSVEFQYGFAGVNYWRGFDNLRQKYLAAQPDGSLVECGVERTEGGEWLNYTRVFDGSKTYNVYLRHGCGLTQPLSLDQIGPGPTTNNLGTLSCFNAFTHSNFRYAPLRDGSGKLAVVNLTNVNTIRLTLASPQIGSVKQGMWMNYLAFVPAAPSAPKLFSSTTVNGTYAEEAGAVVDPINKTITLPQDGARRFYRIGWNTQVLITKVTLTSGNVVLTYQ